MHWNKTHTFTLLLDELISVPENIVNFSLKCTWYGDKPHNGKLNNHNQLWNHVSFVQKQSRASWAIFFLFIPIHPNNLMVSQPLWRFPSLQCCLTESLGIAGIRASSVNQQKYVTWRLIYSDDACLLPCCRFSWRVKPTIRYPLTTMVSETISCIYKDWLFSVGVSELTTWQTLHQWIYHIYKQCAAKLYAEIRLTTKVQNEKVDQSSPFFFHWTKSSKNFVNAGTTIFSWIQRHALSRWQHVLLCRLLPGLII